MRSLVVVTVGLASALALLPGCFVLLDHDLGDDEAEEFVALPSDFEGFEQWPNVVVGTSPAAAPHEAAERRVYLSAAPGDDATHFPVGTMIVKTGSGGEITGTAGDEIHAMVKRAKSFNVDGAVGWEWLELAKAGGEVVIKWRGANPPAGESYGCLPGQDCSEVAVSCNDCHVAARDNDYVQSPALTLGALDDSLLGGAP
jgi:hypothetical protein